MRYYYDFEFLENGSTIELISIGIVSEDDREYYAINSALNDKHGSHSPIDAQPDDGLGLRVSRHEWLMENVVPHLPLRGEVQRLRTGHRPYMPPDLDLTDVRVKPKWVIANEVREFLAYGLSPSDREGVADIELWANFGAYDHVALMQLWGPMIARPKFLPMWTHDLQHEAALLGVAGKEIPIPETDAHNALADARWNKAAHEWLTEI
jgi:hypothetical protein